jgi:hypothetical protein
MKIEGLGTGISQPGGGGSASPRTMTASGSVLDNEGILFVDATLGDVVVTLLQASRGRGVSIMRIDDSAFTVSVVPYSGDTLQGGDAYTIDSQWSSATFRGDGNTTSVIF